MGLGSYKVTPAVAVSDMAKAKEFYEGKLGLSDGEDISDGGHTYPAGESTSIHITAAIRSPRGSGARAPRRWRAKRPAS